MERNTETESNNAKTVIKARLLPYTLLHHIYTLLQQEKVKLFYSQSDGLIKTNFEVDSLVKSMWTPEHDTHM